jgi:ATP-dependent helicase/nuclease subunit A
VSDAALSDAAARRLAQTCFDRPLLLEAGAGTGKTAALVARIVVWSLGPGWEAAAGGAGGSDSAIAARALSGVVAITFTEAAAAEMATRVAEDLARFARGETPSAYFAEAPLPAPPLRRARARALIGALDHLTVRTIHAFCRRLLATYPLEAGVHPDLEVDPDATRAEAIARDVIEEQLAAGLGPSLDPDLAALAEAGFGPSALHEALVALLAEGAAADDLAEELLGEEAVAGFCADLARAAQRFFAAGAEAAFAGASRGSTPTRRQAALAMLARLGSALASEDRPRTLFDLPAALPADPALVSSCLGKWSGRGKEAASDPELRAAAAELKRGFALLVQVEPRALSAARRVLAHALGESVRRLRAAGVATFGALLRDAHALVRGQPALAARIAAEIQQLLVDEFQDTDTLQCELIETLAFGSGQRPALFLVGDPKQSIYGWRNADLAEYEAMRDRVLASGGELARLCVNRRSVPAVLDEARRLVEPVMRETPRLQPRYERLEVHPERAHARGFSGSGQLPVEHWLGYARDDSGALVPRGLSGHLCRLEAETLVGDLLRLRQGGVSLGRVGILLRTTSAFEPLLGALRRAGIPFVVERETKHGERRELVEARAFLRCILDPHDQLALVAALRAPAVGVPDAALVPLWQRDFPKLVAELDCADEAPLRELREVARDAARAMPEVPGAELLAGFEASLAWFLHGLAALRSDFARLPPERFVESLRERWLLEAAEAARFLGEHRVASVERLLRDLAVALEEADGSAAALLSALRRSGTIAREHEEGRPRALVGDAVQVMTIHRAKGLEFDHVYLLQGHRSERKVDRGLRARVHRTFGQRAFELLGMPSPGAWQARAQREETEAHERVRLLYVAATRARERLVIGWSRPPRDVPDPAEAQDLGDLLAHRADPIERARETIARGGAMLDSHGVLWRTPEWQAAPQIERASRTRGALDIARVEADERRLALARADAARREARPWVATASELAGDAIEEREPASASDDERAEEPALGAPRDLPDRARRVAMAAGSAVHAALEHADLALGAAELRTQGEGAIRAALESVLPESERADAERRAHAIWRGACGGELIARLRAIAPRIAARELPVLLAPAELTLGTDAPVGFVSGAIDLLYQDETGEWVVADYKTDAVTPEAIATKAAHYAAQGAAYTRAVQLALSLPSPPRFELWFLQPGVIHVPAFATPRP